MHLLKVCRSNNVSNRPNTFLKIEMKLQLINRQNLIVLAVKDQKNRHSSSEQIVLLTAINKKMGLEVVSKLKEEILTLKVIQ